MRQIAKKQIPLTASWSQHQHATELRAISQVLDQHPHLNELVTCDLHGGKSPTRGRKGLTGEQVLRIGLLKQIHQLDYRELAFHLDDSATFRTFARLPWQPKPYCHKTLQGNVKAISVATWEAVNKALLLTAEDRGIERGRKVRADCTATETNIHEPSDSSLLWDCVRVVSRIVVAARVVLPAIDWSFFQDHRRRAKRRAYEIKFPKRQQDKEGQRLRGYLDLLNISSEVFGYGHRAMELLKTVVVDDVTDLLKVEGMSEELSVVLDSMYQVLEQTRRRVLDDEKVPAAEKLFSIFEPHTDIIIKDRRDNVFGHKLCLSGGASSMILDLVTEDGNPADSTLAKRCIERQIEIYGRPPRQVSFDGGFASKDNLVEIKELGVKDVAFHKKRGLEVTDMAKSAWVFKRLRNFRAGIEGCISALKRGFGLRRCNWRGLEGFKRYAWSSVVAYNAMVLAGYLTA
jgi:IS5 family transposase